MASSEPGFAAAPDDTLRLVADIGGTHARFALAVDGATPPRLRAIHTLQVAGHPSLEHAIRTYLAAVGAHPAEAAIAVASPVTGDAIRMTNHAWTFSRLQLQAQLGFGRLLVINDFAAAALAVPVLAADDFAWLQGVPSAAAWRGPITVLGPGTGLGVALLVATPSGTWQALATEGGHAGFAALDPEERQIARWIRRRHGRCSNERLLSGPGLTDIHAALAAVGADATAVSRCTPAELVQAALASSDALARRTLDRFCAVLGSVAGDLVLSHGARMAVIAGGIVPRLLPLLRASAFQERFVAKGRMTALLASTPVAVVLHAHPGLLGAALALAHASAPLQPSA